MPYAAARTAHTGAVTLIQRFVSALNLNIHFHMLFLDGAYVDHATGTARVTGAAFHSVFTPGILPSALRASRWLLRIAPGDFVRRTASTERW